MLTAIAGVGPVDAGVDHYVLAPDMTVGLKLRSGRAELKKLVRTITGLEQWEPQAPIPFPATGRALEAFLRPLGPPYPNPDHIFPDVDAVARWIEAERGLPLTSLRKRRRAYLLVDARAELGEVRWKGTRLETLAVEGIHSDTVAALVARLGLANAANTSYPRLLLGCLSA